MTIERIEAILDGIAADLARMLRRRASADYELSETLTRRDAEFTVAMAVRAGISQ